MTRRRFTIAAVVVGCLMLGAIAFFVATMRHGFSAADQPTAMEAMMARSMRRFSAPADLRDAKNPLPLTPEILAEARAHFADHCATCHGNDGKGSDMGKRMYPRAPDMTQPSTQRQSDGELFAAIENGVRLTGMPSFGTGTAESAYATWTLVHFIRHLPKLTEAEREEMERLNPKSPEEYEQMKAEESFLAGEDQGEKAHEHH